MAATPHAGRLDRNEKLQGLDPSDTVAEYTDSRGNRRLAVSNRIGLCIPRFLIFKSETVLASQLARLSTGAMLAAKTPANVNGELR